MVYFISVRFDFLCPKTNNRINRTTTPKKDIISINEILGVIPNIIVETSFVSNNAIGVKEVIFELFNINILKGLTGNAVGFDDLGDGKLNCIPEWGDCQWSACKDGVQDFVCIDANNCKSDIGRPHDVKMCLVDGDCQDRDEDGFGLGPDCIGLDFNDYDEYVNANPPKQLKLGNTRMLLLIFGILIAIALVVVLIVYLVNRGKNSSVSAYQTN